ncbi:GAF domain-containing protein [Candidatus Villigracilis affinis]|uniref:GAF domain-containing protein n=1 Tax=Candidatus Villigracilis affinis TaxID=3140682 RepID=UPI002A20BD3C|nr:GAF domain-containing protein [Anaerolineales bacterium]
MSGQKPSRKSVRFSDEESFSLLFENHPVPMWIHDSKTQAIIDVNEAALTKYGYTRDEFLALSVRDIRIMQDEDITDSLPPSGECRHYKKNGEVIDVAVITHKLNYGKIETVLVMAQDITERKRAQNALHESEQILKESQTIAGIGSYVLDFNTGTWTSSTALDQIFGIDESYNHSIEGWLNLIHPEQQQEMSDYFINEVAGKRTRFDREYRIVRKNDQAERWVHGLGELEIDSQNNLLKMHGVIQDITKHKQAKDALRRQLNNLNSLYQMTAIIGQTSSVEDIYEAALNSLQSMLLTDRTAILLLDQNGVMRFKTWHGISEEYRNAVEGHSPWDVKAIDPQPFPVPDARKEPSLTALLNALEQENIRSLVFIPLINQGHLLGKFMIYYNEPHVFTNEEIQLAQTIARHVTFAILRRQSEDELHLRSSVLNAAANAIVITNIDGIIEWVNPAFSTLTGYTLEEAVNKNPRDIVKSGEHDKGFYQNMWKTILSGKVWHGEMVNRRKDGSFYDEEQTITPLKNANGEITHFISVKQDITPRKQTEKIVNQWLAEQNTLHQVSQSLLSVHLDPDMIYSTLHEAVLQIMPCDAFTIVMDDKKNGDYHAVYLYDMEKRYPSRHIPHGQGLSEKVISNGQTLFIHDDMEANTPAVHFGSSTPVRSILAVPLRKHRDTIGMISVQSYQPNVYDERHRVLLETLAAQVTTVIENASLFAETRQRLVELELLYESGLVLNQLLNPRELGAKIVELLEQKLGWHHITVRLVHPQDGSLELLAFNQPGLKDEAEQHEVAERFQTLISRVGQGVSGWAVEHKQVVRSNDLPHDPRYIDTYPGLQSGLYVPMKLGDRIIGVISIESEQPNAFSEADERLAATLANQAASAIENARLFDAERNQHQMSDALRDALKAGASMSTSLDFETILDRLLETIKRIVPFEGGTIMVIQPEQRKISIAKMHGYKVLNKEMIEKISSFSFEISSAENLRWLIENKQPMFISDVRQYPGWVRIPESEFIRSWLGAPIIVNNEVIALFSLDSIEPNFFTKEHAELLQAFTGQASLALQNARLFNETAQRAREFASLYETSSTLSIENELEVLLQNIVEKAKEMLKSNSSGIYLYHPENEELELSVITATYTSTGVRLHLGEGVAGWVAKNHQPLRIDDYSKWENRSKKYESVPIRAVLEVPMLYGGELIGVLTADEIGDSERKFTEADEHLLSLFASQAAGAIHSARLREQTSRRVDQLQALHAIDRAISSSFDLRLILNTVISQTITQLNVDAADILLFNPYLQTLEYVSGQGFRTRSIEQSRLRLGEGHAGRVALERTVVHIPNLFEAEAGFARAALLSSESFLEYYGVPLIAKGEVKGVLEVFHRTPLHASPDWLGFLETLAGQAAITIDQTQLFDDLQRANLELIIAYDTTIEGWSHAMDLRDEETEGHTRRVTEMTLALAKKMGINDDQMLHIRRGALLHDIGKMGIPDRILLKEEKLTEAEWKIMRQHPNYAHDMLQPIKYLRKSLDIPYCHHEKWDGTGYPRGLKGEQIPLVARIFAIIDVWDAVTIDRPYRKAWTKQKALKYIREQSGKHFDPVIVAAFLEIFDKKESPASTGKTKKRPPNT